MSDSDANNSKTFLIPNSDNIPSNSRNKNRSKNLTNIDLLLILIKI